VRHLAYRQRNRRFPPPVMIEQEQPPASNAGALRRELLTVLVDKVRSQLTERAQAVAGKVMQGASIAAIAADLRLHRTQVYREIERIRRAIAALLCHSKHFRSVGPRHVDAEADMDLDQGDTWSSYEA
jgi:DNA-binding NarL/FixJ family response regulator